MKPHFKKKPPTRQMCGGIRRPIQPHVLIFAFLCLLYFVPLWLVSMGTYAKGGVLPVGADADRGIGKIALADLLGFLFFCIGSWSVPKKCLVLDPQSEKEVNL